MQTHRIELRLSGVAPQDAGSLARALGQVDRVLAQGVRFEARRGQLEARSMGIPPETLVMVISTALDLVAALTALRAAVLSLRSIHEEQHALGPIEVHTARHLVRIPFDASLSQVQVGLAGLRSADVIKIEFKPARPINLSVAGEREEGGGECVA